MFNKKLKRTIAIQKQFIANRDEIINYQREKIKKLRNQNEILTINYKEVEELLERLVKVMYAGMSDDKILRKLKELVTDYQS